MRFSIELEGITPAYLQLEDQIRYAVSVGELRPGDRLPSIRKLEAELGINRNTIRRAYLDLEDEGTLAIRQGRVPEVVAEPPRPGRTASASLAGELAEKMVRDVESKGLDVLGFASVFGGAAADHDRRYPKCVFIECSRCQADDLARAAGASWGRRVIGVDLERLRGEPGSIPASVQHALTTGWHLAEVRRLLKGRGITVRQVTVRLSRETLEGIRRLAGLKTGIILRDPESLPGYGRLIGRLAKVKGPVRAALLGEEEKALELLRGVKAVVCTAPCREFVRKLAPSGLVVQELVYEAAAHCIRRIGNEIFPSLDRSAAGRERRNEAGSS